MIDGQTIGMDSTVVDEADGCKTRIFGIFGNVLDGTVMRVHLCGKNNVYESLYFSY